MLSQGKSGNKTVQLVLQHCCKTSWKAMLLVLLASFKPIFQQIRLLKGCENLLEKVGSSSTFCNKICSCFAFYRLKANLFCRKWRNSRVWHDSRVTLSNQKSVFTQLATTWFAARQVWFLRGTTRNIAIQLVLHICCRITCTFLSPVLP